MEVARQILNTFSKLHLFVFWLLFGRHVPYISLDRTLDIEMGLEFVK